MKHIVTLVAAYAATAAFAMPGQGQGGQGGQQSSPYNFLFLMVGFVVIMYFFMIKPEQRRKREKEDLLRNVGVGDKVVTSGGIHGEVKQVKEKTVRLQVDDHTRLEVEKVAIALVVEKGTGEGEKK